MREQDRDQVKSNWEMKEKFADEQRIKAEEQMRRTQEEMALRMGKQEEELRRRQQENTLFMQVSWELRDVGVLLLNDDTLWSVFMNFFDYIPNLF